MRCDEQSIAQIMVKMLLDTSVWLDLARDPKDVALIGIIERLIDDKLLTLVVPKVVFNEFVSCRDRVAVDYGKRVSSHFRTVREVVEASGAPEDEIASILRFLQAVEQDGQRRTKLASQTFGRIERLLSKAAHVEPSERVKSAVYERAMARKAPFHEGENEAADAVIIETYAEGVQGDAANAGLRWMFVTRNTTHFSAAKGSEKIPHPHFICFTPGRSEYFINLPDALRSVEPSLVTQLLQTWELEQPTIADLIDRYVEEAAKNNEPRTTRYYKLVQLKGLPIGSRVAAKLQVKDIVDQCRSRKAAGVEVTTIRHDLDGLRFLLHIAENEWGVLGVSTDTVTEALVETEKLGLAGNFYVLQGRRPTPDEIARLVDYFKKQETGPKGQIPMSGLMEFALASGRRIQEICSIRWESFDEPEKTCKMERKTVPLTDEAIAIIKQQPRTDDFVFWHRAKSASAAFTHAKRELEMVGLRFQDLRREAVMRMLAGKVPLERIEGVTGLGPMSLRRYRDEFAKENGISVETKTKSVRKLRFVARR